MSLPPHNGKIVLVTGINGYIASVIGLKILHSGYSLRGTVRSKDKATTLLSGAYREYACRVEIIEVLDMSLPNAFDEAVKGVHAIHHTASPMNFALRGWDNWVSPAVNGCMSILESACKCAGSQLESFVLLSSAAAIADPTYPPGYNLTEADWNNFAEARCKSRAAAAPSNLAYPASKAATERALWRFRSERRPFFSISAVNPSTVFGPPAQMPVESTELSVTLQSLLEVFSGKLKVVPPPFAVNSSVDVRDVAQIHLWCMEHSVQSEGQRYLASSGKGCPQAMVDLLRGAYPERNEIIPKGQPKTGYMPDFSPTEGSMKCYGKKVVGTIGMKYLPYDQTILETAEALKVYL